MDMKNKMGLKIGGLTGSIISLILIYHGKKIFPELLNTLFIAFLPWLGAAIGDRYIKP